MEHAARPPLIAIARIVRTRGNRGEVLADIYTDYPSRFDSVVDVRLEFAGGQIRRLVLEETWRHKDRQVLKFAGVDTISAAEELVGAWVGVPVEEAVPLPEGTYFDHDLAGCLVRDPQGRKLGTVVEVLRISGNNQLVVRGDCGEFLIPAAEPICKSVSISGKEIIVDLPEGLMDLNK